MKIEIHLTINIKAEIEIATQQCQREENVAIFEHTLVTCKELNDVAIMESYQQKVEVYTTGTQPIRKMPQTKLHATEYHIRTPDAIVEARKIIAAKGEASIPLVLNMADPEEVGGGVDNGSSTEEALLCRCTTLYPRLVATTKKARMPEEGGIYFDRVKIIKDSNGKELRSPEEIAIINVAAFKATDPKKIKTNIQLMLRKAFWEGHTHLVLGDYGCVTFRSYPNTVAIGFRQVFESEEFKNVFETIIFAIPDDYVRGIFANVLECLTKNE